MNQQLRLSQAMAGIYLNAANQAEVRFIRLKKDQLYSANSEHGWEEPLAVKDTLLLTNQEYQGNHRYAFSPDYGQLIYRSRAFYSVLERVEPAQLSISDLKRFKGRYYSPELGKSFRITQRKNKLRLSFFHLFHVPLLALSNHRFLANLQGNNCLAFERDSTGSVRGFTLSRDSVTKLRFIKR